MLSLRMHNLISRNMRGDFPISRNMRGDFPEEIHLWRRWGVADIRNLSDEEIIDMRGVGPKSAAEIRSVRDRWTDDQIVREWSDNLWFSRSIVAPNWVGEAVPA